MPVQTRAKAPEGRVYNSPVPQQQVRFQPRKRHVSSRRSLGSSRRSRQQTLTQIDFVNLQEAMDQEEEDQENQMSDKEKHTKQHKRRRTEGDAPSSSSKYHTQTLTQLEFVSTPASRLEGLDEEIEGWSASHNAKHQKTASPDQCMGPPKTPSRRRVYEVPSSQSPLSPASIRSHRSLPTRSPLKESDANLQLQWLSPLRRRNKELSPDLKREIHDTDEFENESQQSRVPQTPKRKSNPMKSPQSIAEAQLLATHKKCIKDEIQDSDEDDELDMEDTGFGQESQPNQVRCELSLQVNNSTLNPSFSDTQEAEEQLQSTILQFTQQIPSTNEEKEEEEQIRPSQATTVSLTQPPTSSPIFSKRPNQLTPSDATFTEDYEGIITIPDSPKYKQAADLSVSPTLPRPPLETRQETQTCTSIRETPTEADAQAIPFYLASSQILTRSQMLPDSLMNESLRAPPLLIEDSDYEE